MPSHPNFSANHNNTARPQIYYINSPPNIAPSQSTITHPIAGYTYSTPILFNSWLVPASLPTIPYNLIPLGFYPVPSFIAQNNQLSNNPLATNVILNQSNSSDNTFEKCLQDKTKNKKRRKSKAPAPELKEGEVRKCADCGATGEKTSQWRCGPDGNASLCGKCGLRYSAHYSKIIEAEKKIGPENTTDRIKLSKLINSEPEPKQSEIAYTHNTADQSSLTVNLNPSFWNKKRRINTNNSADKENQQTPILSARVSPSQNSKESNSQANSALTYRSI